MNKKDMTVLGKCLYRVRKYIGNAIEYQRLGKNDKRLPAIRLSKMLKYATKHCAYYKNLNVKPDCLESFPILTKDIIRKRFDDMISDESNKLVYIESYTGGSTGEPLYFFNQMTYDIAYQAKLWKRMGYSIGDKILAIDGTKCSDSDLKKRKYWGRKGKINMPYGKYYLSSLYLTNNTVAEYVDYIKALKPSFIRGYPIAIYTIAKFILDNNIDMGSFVKGIQITSESSFQYQREMISKAFGARVYGQYGHTEYCVFGYTRSKSFYYIVEPLYGHVEVLDSSNNPVKCGEIGEVVVTSYFNKIMPFIRYKTGDYAEFGGYKNGKLILTKIYGRTQDYVYDDMGNKVLITALVMGQHFKAMGHIAKWQIVQSEPGKVTMNIIKGKDWTSSDEIEISSLFMENAKIEVAYNYVECLPTTERGKSKLVIQQLKESDFA